jgi:class 3 adenylate cyclase
MLRRRERASLAARKALDARAHARLGRRLAVVYTDTDDFTRRVERHGLLHFLMVFARGVRELRPVIAAHGGRLVKVEADSLLLAFPDALRACRACLRMLRTLERGNRGRPASERLAFSFGIGCGEIVDLGRDLFGLEVNLASKLGEDRALPGEILLTPAAAAAVAAASPALAGHLSPHGTVRFTDRAMPVTRLATSDRVLRQIRARQETRRP